MDAHQGAPSSGKNPSDLHHHWLGRNSGTRRFLVYVRSSGTSWPSPSTIPSSTQGSRSRARALLQCRRCSFPVAHSLVCHAGDGLQWEHPAHSLYNPSPSRRLQLARSGIVAHVVVNSPPLLSALPRVLMLRPAFLAQMGLLVPPLFLFARSRAPHASRPRSG